MFCLSYGERGHGKIPPNASLRYEVEVLQLREDAPLYYWRHADIQAPKGHLRGAKKPYQLRPQEKVTEDMKVSMARDDKIARLNAFLLNQRKMMKDSALATAARKAGKTKRKGD